MKSVKVLVSNSQIFYWESNEYFYLAVLKTPMFPLRFTFFLGQPVHNWSYRCLKVHARSYMSLHFTPGGERPYRTIKNHSGPYRAMQDPTVSYRTIQCMVYMIIQDRSVQVHASLCDTIQDCTSPYKAGPCRTIQDGIEPSYTSLCKTKQDHCNGQI